MAVIAHALSSEFGRRIMQARDTSEMDFKSLQTLVSPGEHKLLNQDFSRNASFHRWSSTRTSYSSNQLTVSSARPTRPTGCQRTLTMARQYGGGTMEVLNRRGWANAYELSQDLQEKQVELLENRYGGGTMQPRRAATIIQQAYRQYRMARNFSRMRLELEERKLSKRLIEFRRSRTVWSDMTTAVTAQPLLDDFLTDDYINLDSSTMRLFTGEFDHYMSYDVMSHSHSADSMLQHVSASVRKSSLMSSRKCVYNSDRHSQTEIHRQSVNHQTFRQNVYQKNAAIHPNTINEENENPYCGQDISGKNFTPDFRGEVRKAADIKKPDALSSFSFNQKLQTSSDLNKTKPGAVNIFKPESQNKSAAEPIDNIKVSLQCLDDLLQELSASSSGESMISSPSKNRPVRGTKNEPVEQVVDVPSENFEHLLETSCSRESLDDSFHSDDSCNDPVDDKPVSNAIKSSEKSVTQSSVNPCSVTQSSVAKSSQSSASNASARPLTIHQAAGKPAQSAQTNSQLAQENSLTPTVDYSTMEVKLRKKKTNGEETGPNKSDPKVSPIWKRKSQSTQLEDVNIRGLITSQNGSVCSSPTQKSPSVAGGYRDKVMSSPLGSGARGSCQGSYRLGAQRFDPQAERQRKRMYRVGLNLFNKKPESGVKYLTGNGFVDDRPEAVARFLLSRKGLSKQMIGEYLGNLQNPFNMEVLSCFAEQIELTGLQLDTALRKFQSYFRMPGEAQKIERLMEAFASRYWECNPEVVSKFHRSDTIFLLAFAIIMLNTDLHNSSIKPERKMKLEDFIKNLRGIDDGHDVDPTLLTGIYQRIKDTEFKAGSDHVGHVLKVEQMIVGKKPQLSLPHRRLVCYCRLYEVVDPSRKDKPGHHQREVFLFNDILMITKLLSKKKLISYTFRQSFSLNGMTVTVFETQCYKFGIRLVADDKILLLLNARNEDDRKRFVEDLNEAIQEVSDMESLRIDEELKKQKYLQNSVNLNRYSKDSGVVDVEMLKLADQSLHRLSAPECARPKKSTLSNSLIELRDGSRRASGASLDSGVQASTESGSVSSCQEAGAYLKNSRHQAL